MDKVDYYKPHWVNLGLSLRFSRYFLPDSSDVLCDVEQQDHDEAVGWPGAEAVPDVEKIVGEKLNVRGQVAVGVLSAGD